MKKIILFFVIIFLSGCTHVNETIKYNYKINNSKIFFLNNENSKSIIVYNNQKYTLFLLEGKNIAISKYKRIIPQIDNIVSNKDFIIDTNYDKWLKYSENMMINNINVNIIDKIKLKIDNDIFCIYDKNINSEGNYNECDYIYVLNNEKNVYINLNDNMKIFFYRERSNFSVKFLEHLYTTWIDTYIISNDKLILLELGNEYNVIEFS